jgi:hypothetical protein
MLFIKSEEDIVFVPKMSFWLLSSPTSGGSGIGPESFIHFVIPACRVYNSWSGNGSYLDIKLKKEGSNRIDIFSQSQNWRCFLETEQTSPIVPSLVRRDEGR